MRMIALELGTHGESGRPNSIFGNHVRKMERDKNISSATALREILCDWWSDHLYDISHEEAINRLIQISQMDSIIVSFSRTLFALTIRELKRGK